MLLAGACANDTAAWGGALAFYVYVSPPGANWVIGSANMLLAGASAVYTRAFCGSFTFDADCIPSWTA